jgi:hypothetical protein
MTSGGIGSRREKVLRRQRQATLARLFHQYLLTLRRYQPARPPLFLGISPTADARLVAPCYFSDGAKSATYLNDCVCWLHAAYIAIFATFVNQKCCDFRGCRILAICARCIPWM